MTLLTKLKQTILMDWHIDIDLELRGIRKAMTISKSRLMQLGSILLTFTVYSLILNWRVGLLFVVAIGFHEQSHLLAAKYTGLRTNKFYLLPFMGGVAFVTSRYRSYAQQAIVVLAGPIGGGLLAAATAGVYLITGIPFLAAAAYWMGWLNLFNLLPLSFMDGGQIMGTLTYSFDETLGMVCLTVSTIIAVFAMWFFNPILMALIALYGGQAVVKEIRNWKAKRAGKSWLCTDDYLNRPKKLNDGEKILVACCWFGSAGLLTGLILQLSQIPGHNFMAIFHR